MLRNKTLFFTAFLSLICTLLLLSCQSEEMDRTSEKGEQKIGILLVNHGSHSETWRNALLDVEKHVKDDLMKDGNVKGVKTAFMEYNEPSIATRMKEFDKEGYTDVIIVPIFLTVSPHTFEDIPTIVGLKEDPESKEMLQLEKIERYTAKAKVHITPLLDFTDILKKNVLRRVKELSKDPANEGLVLIGYGDEDYEKEWIQLFNDVANYVKKEVGISHHSYGWCGHIARYNPDETTKAIDKALARKQKAVVVPVLVAHDENFQIKIIGGGIENVKDNKTRVIYKPDAILPDVNVDQWVIDISAEYVKKIRKN